MKCRHCGTELKNCFVDLGSAPPSNAYLSQAELKEPEMWYPLKVMVCEQCWLVQTEDFAGRDKFFDANYAYFSSFSCTWLSHAEKYVEDMVKRFSLTAKSYVIEVAANDGYLLQFVKSRQIPCVGIEPTHSTAEAARKKELIIIEDFFGVRLAEELKGQNKQADLIVANNVLAHVPDINDFVSGFAMLLKDNGVATFEFPHLYNLVGKNQFDTIYHEHFSYLSLTAVTHIFQSNGLNIFDVEELTTHGGSIRVFTQRMDTGRYDRSPQVDRLLEKEEKAGVCTLEYYTGFQCIVENIKNALLSFLLTVLSKGETVVAYGAAAKGNTLLNFSGIHSDLISFVVDRNPAKIGKFLPGSHIPVVDEAFLYKKHPDYIIIFPWNLKDEIMVQLEYIRDWNGKFVTAIPCLDKQ